MLDLSIIILTYKSKDHLAVLLPSVFGSLGLNFTPNKFSREGYNGEVIIVDNDSRDGTAEFAEN